MQPRDESAEVFARLKRAIDGMVVFSPGQEKARGLVEDGPRHVCLVGGTRSGKTFLIVRQIVTIALRAPHSRHAILRFSGNAARSSISLDTLPTVMRRCFPDERYEEHRNDGFFELSNESQIWVGGLGDKDRVEKILGQEYLTVFLNEASQIPYASYLVAMTRLAQTIHGERQRVFIDLNPVEKTHWTNQLFGEARDPISKTPLPNPDAYARAFLNPRDNEANLSAEYLASLAAMPSRQRKRFYEGVYVEELDGALWKIADIEETRIHKSELPDFTRVVVAIDPATTSGPESDETGIIVAALGTNGHGYILADGSGRYVPTEWARKAVELYTLHGADRIIGEVNQGGQMIEATLRVVNPNIPFKAIHASRGKIVRAEPVAALYEQKKVHHVGTFNDLEDQMVSYTVGSNKSPDRLDAAVYALSELMVTQGAGIIEWYRQQVEGHQVNVEVSTAQSVRLAAPEGISTVYLMSGRMILIGGDRTILVSETDAKPLRAQGWKELQNA